MLAYIPVHAWISPHDVLLLMNQRNMIESVSKQLFYNIFFYPSFLRCFLRRFFQFVLQWKHEFIPEKCQPVVPASHTHTANPSHNVIKTSLQHFQSKPLKFIACALQIVYLQVGVTLPKINEKS